MENRSPKAFECIRLIERQDKPRTSGITYVRDRGMGLKALEAMLEISGEYIDILKMAVLAPRLQSREMIKRKVEMCHDQNIEVGLGGAILEIAMLQGPDVVKASLEEARELGVDHIEVCRFIAIASLSHMLEIVDMVKEYGIKPIAEVGAAHGITEEEEVFVDVDRIIGTMKKYLERGAWKVLLESEGITESRKPSEYRWDVVSKVANAFDLDEIMFEAADENVFTYYIKEYGPEVNLFVDISQVLECEMARLGAWGKHPVINRVATFYRK